MNPLAAAPTDPELLAAGQVAVAALLGTAGLYFQLPRPRGRRVALGVFLALAAVAVLAAFLVTTFGRPWQPDAVGQVLFWLFAAGAVFFGVVLVAQRNPARGAIAFAFVILSTCGLFLLLAAPFLMAATVIVYAGAIIVTFLFVLMLSQTDRPSDENDRSREPLLGSLAGFAFAGLVLFALYLDSPAAAADGRPAAALPAPPLTPAERDALARAASEFTRAEAELDANGNWEKNFHAACLDLDQVVGLAPGEPLPPGAASARFDASLQQRLRPEVHAPRVWRLTDAADRLRDRKKAALARVENAQLNGRPVDRAAVKQDTADLRDGARLLAGSAELPAANVAAVGYSLYSEHLVAVEMAGTLLLVATIGAVAIAGRKRETP
jgi:NADH:ubiquinone oxidoreductase subunit 6 (subunit J)